MLLWAVAKLYYAKVSQRTVANIYYWLQGFKGVGEKVEPKGDK